MILDPKMLDELGEKLASLLPQDVKILKDDFEKNVKLTLQNTLSRMDLVTREEFDAQTEVLSRTRNLLEELASRVDALEKKGV